jgi:ClpP class serine protease
MIDAGGTALARLATGGLHGWMPQHLGGFEAWAEPHAAVALAWASGERAPAPGMRATATAWRDHEEGRVRLYPMAGAVALVSVRGLIVPSFPWLGCSWVTGCAELRMQLEAAVADPEVRGIALVVDSPGGYVAGVDETVQALHAAREEKPVIAATDTMATSAAYWIASGADQVTAPRTGCVGHVGVMRVHLDMSGALEAAGVRATLLHSGEYKVDGHPFQPLSDRARANEQRSLDALRRLIADHVAEGRRGAIDAAGVIATEARAFEGPEGVAEAASLGLIDAVVPAERAVGLFAEHLAGAAG